jgi:tRNA (uracil-5-)-methyltransferase
MAEHDTSLVDGVTWMRFEPEQYDAELERKVAATRAQFAHLLDGAEVKIHASSPTHYRQRVRLALSRCAPDDRLSYMLWDHKGPWLRLEQPRFPVASEAINALMPPLLEALNASDVLGAGVAQVHFLSTQVGDMLVTLHYRHELHPGWREAGEALRASLGIPALLGRARRDCVVLGRDHVTERYALADGRQLEYRQMEGAFCNPSASMCEHTLGWLCSAAEAIAAEAAPAGGAAEGGAALLELFCGNGNHTVALARHFRSVVGVEISPRLCEAAEHNLRHNGVETARVLRAPSARVCHTLLRALTAPPHVLPAALGGGSARFDAIVVDPPRAGLDPPTLRLAALHDHILYVSCCPPQLLANLRAAELDRTHAVRRFAVFDHFPYTPHLECAVWLARRAVPIGRPLPAATGPAAVDGLSGPPSAGAADGRGAGADPSAHRVRCRLRCMSRSSLHASLAVFAPGGADRIPR